MLFAAAIGGLLGVVIFLFARWQRYDQESAFYPTVLIVIASYYVLFAIMADNTSALIAQLAIAAVFVVLAVIGRNVDGRIVALGIVLHGLYDFAFHWAGGGGGVPVWWPAFCGTVDLVVGLTVLAAIFHSTQAKPN
jgi:hypothetical protein